MNESGLKAKEKDRWLERIYRQYQPRIYGFLLKKLKAVEQAEDMTSQVFLEVTRCADRFDPSRASESTWIYTICRNLLNRHLRDTYTQRRIIDIDQDKDVDEVYVEEAREIDRYIASTELAEALSRLSRDKRNVLLLSYYYGLGPREIAARLALSYTNVCALKSRALREMQEALKSADGGRAHK